MLQIICGSFVSDNPSIQLSEDAASLFAGGNYAFECITAGRPLPTVTWLMNGKELKGGEMNQTIVLEEKSEGDHLNVTLHISDVELRHAGNYTCEAVNKYSMKARNNLVTVSCKRILLVLLPSYALILLNLRTYKENQTPIVVQGGCGFNHFPPLLRT